MGPPKKNVPLYSFLGSGGYFTPNFSGVVKPASFWEWNFRLSTGPGAGPNPEITFQTHMILDPNEKNTAKNATRKIAKQDTG